MIEFPVEKTINKRHSCRTYRKEYLKENDAEKIRNMVQGTHIGPLASRIRFTLVAASEENTRALKELGTYGFIKNPAGFIIGAVTDEPRCLEDFGYMMERYILYATHMGIGTCWLGGSFTKSTFSLNIDAKEKETVPAVVSVGYPAENRSRREGLLRWGAGSDRRKPWEELFFSKDGEPLTKDSAGEYALPLEMLRRGPSASNKQPWRIFRENNTFHFYLERTKGYYNEKRSMFITADIQRIDMGIAMCHFELSAKEKDINGAWKIHDKDEIPERDNMEYIVSWK